MDRNIFLAKARIAFQVDDWMQAPGRHLVDAAWLYGKGAISDGQRRAVLLQYGGVFLGSDRTGIPAWHLVCRSASAAHYSARGSKPAPGYPWEGHQRAPQAPETAYKGYAETITAYVAYAAASDLETLQDVEYAVEHARRAWELAGGKDRTKLLTSC